MILLLLGCVGLRTQGGVVHDLQAHQNVVVADLGLDMTLGPKTTTGVWQNRIRFEHIDFDAPCHYELHLGVRGQFAQDRALVGPAAGMLGHCHMSDRWAFQWTGGVKLVELGTVDQITAVGLTSPYTQAGFRLTLGEGLFLGAEGLGGYDVRVRGTNHLYAGGLLRLTYGILP
ncbi:MAG: hypothetical protein GY913_12900 [Proteobacteria bacterium]|nr:hypothetical protein [Pseudomonadota bacterium]MCP4917805.1 hypothetical protein [Pseudomonadota bacterium]